jgi:hypothetical protein
MFKRLSLTTFAAAALLATAALSPASAHGHGHPGHHPGHGHPGHFKGGYWAHWHQHHPDHYHWGHWGHWHEHPGYGTYTQPVAATCNCLTKDYLPDGRVVFTDRCTNETAAEAPRG